LKEAKEFMVVECKGTPYEIGRQYGAACRDNILKSLEMNFGALIHGQQATKEEIITNALKFVPNVKSFDPDIIEFITGQADGAGISFEEAFSLRCMLELGLYYKQIIGLCTSFAATGEATAEGKAILGQNIDWIAGFPMDLLKFEYKNGVKQLVLSLGGIVEYTLNSHGIGMCANSIFNPVEEYYIGIPVGCYLPKAMRQQKIGDALGILCLAARGIGYYHLASAQGDIVGVESVLDDFNVLHPERDMLVHSNHYFTDRFKKGDWAYVVLPDSYLRSTRIKRLMDKHYGSITPQVMMELLSDHNNHPSSICRHVDNDKPPQFRSETLASYIMVPEDQVMYIAYGNPCQYEYVEYKL
jgi:isopenicillin-N N-acyltransferase-like protein